MLKFIKQWSTNPKKAQLEKSKQELEDTVRRLQTTTVSKLMKFLHLIIIQFNRHVSFLNFMIKYWQIIALNLNLQYSGCFKGSRNQKLNLLKILTRAQTQTI